MTEQILSGSEIADHDLNRTGVMQKVKPIKALSKK